MKKIVTSFLLALTLANVGSSNTFVANAQTNEKIKEDKIVLFEPESYFVERDKEKIIQALQPYDENHQMFDNFKNNQPRNEFMDHVLFENFSIIEASVTEYYENLADIPSSIYFDSYGYTGYIAKDTQELDSDKQEIKVVFKGIAFRNGPATGAE